MILTDLPNDILRYLDLSLADRSICQLTCRRFHKLWGVPTNSYLIGYDLATHGHLKPLMLLKIPLCEETANAAARRGHLNVLIWLIHEGVNITSDAMVAAAYYGHLETVQWLYEMEIQIKYYVLFVAVQQNHKSICDYICKIVSKSLGYNSVKDVTATTLLLSRFTIQKNSHVASQARGKVCRITWPRLNAIGYEPSLHEKVSTEAEVD